MKKNRWHIITSSILTMVRTLSVNTYFTFCRLMVVLDSSDAYKECFLKRSDFCEKPPRAMNYFLNFDDGNQN